MAELKLAARLDAVPVDMRRPGGLQRGLQVAARLGVSAVEICARTIIRPSELSDTGLRQLRKMLDDLNLRVASVRFQTRRGYDNPQDLEQRIEATKQAMLLAYRVGAPVVVNQIGRIPEIPQQQASAQKGSSNSADAISPEQERWNALQSVLDDLGRYGAKVGAFLAAETGAEPGERLAQLLDLSDEAYIAAALNPGQLIINRHQVPAAVKALRDRIQVVAAVDGVLDLAAGRGVSVPVGEGVADFPLLIGMLEDVQYRGYFVVGRPDAPADQSLQEMHQSVEYLKGL